MRLLIVFVGVFVVVAGAEDGNGEGRALGDVLPVASEDVKEAGKVAGVLFLDSVDAAKDVAQRRLNSYLDEERKSERQERNIMSEPSIIWSAPPLQL